jgi:hypothetical protein
MQELYRPLLQFFRLTRMGVRGQNLGRREDHGRDFDSFLRGRILFLFWRLAPNYLFTPKPHISTK